MTISKLPFDLHPKVAYSTLALAVVGLALIALGALLHDPTVRTLGLGAAGSAISALGVGYTAPPAQLEQTTGAASDDILSPEARAEIAATTAPVEPDKV